jgi:TnsA endonuclease N terminal
MPRNEDSKYRQGKYRPQNPEKYNGDPTNIVYRSSYELKFMQYCDLTESVNGWKSEEFWIPYRSPIDNKIHRYFPDFFVKYKDKNGNNRHLVVEIKPQKDLKMPETNPKRKTKSWAYAVKTWAVNQAKWKAAKEYCADRNYEFRVLTEKELGIKL